MLWQGDSLRHPGPTVASVEGQVALAMPCGKVRARLPERATSLSLGLHALAAVAESPQVQGD